MFHYWAVKLVSVRSITMIPVLRRAGKPHQRARSRVALDADRRCVDAAV